MPGRRRGRRGTLRTALEVARRLDDRGLIIEAATLWTPIWTSMPTLSPRERIELLSEGARRTDDLGVRALLRARLATELTLTPEWQRARALADKAISDVRESGAQDALPEVFMRHFQATCTPHNLAERRRNIEEAVAVSVGSPDPVHRFFALSTAAAGRDRVGRRRHRVELPRHRVRSRDRARRGRARVQHGVHPGVAAGLGRRPRRSRTPGPQRGRDGIAPGHRQCGGWPRAPDRVRALAARALRGAVADGAGHAGGGRSELRDPPCPRLPVFRRAIKTRSVAWNRRRRTTSRIFPSACTGRRRSSRLRKPRTWSATTVSARSCCAISAPSRTRSRSTGRGRLLRSRSARRWRPPRPATTPRPTRCSNTRSVSSDRLRAPLLRARTEIGWSRVLLARDALSGTGADPGVRRQGPARRSAGRADGRLGRCAVAPGRGGAGRAARGPPYRLRPDPAGCDMGHDQHFWASARVGALSG